MKRFIILFILFPNFIFAHQRAIPHGLVYITDSRHPQLADLVFYLSDKPWHICVNDNDGSLEICGQEDCEYVKRQLITTGWDKYVKYEGNFYITIPSKNWYYIGYILEPWVATTKNVNGTYIPVFYYGWENEYDYEMSKSGEKHPDEYWEKRTYNSLDELLDDRMVWIKNPKAY